MIKFVFLKSLEKPISIFSGLLMMKCSYSISDLCTILSKIPEMTEEDYRICIAGYYCEETVEVVFHIPDYEFWNDDEDEHNVMDMLKTRRFFYNVNGKLFYCPRSCMNNFSKYHCINNLNIVHVRSDSSDNYVREFLITNTHKHFDNLIAIRNNLYTLIMVKAN